MLVTYDLSLIEPDPLIAIAAAAREVWTEDDAARLSGINTNNMITNFKKMLLT